MRDASRPRGSEVASVMATGSARSRSWENPTALCDGLARFLVECDNPPRTGGAVRRGEEEGALEGGSRRADVERLEEAIRRS